MRTVLTLCFILSSLQAFAQQDQTYTFRLNRADSMEFIDLLKGFSGPKRVVDPENDELLHTKFWYLSADNQIAMSCTKMEYHNKLKRVACDFEFHVSSTGHSVEVLDQESLAIRAVIKDPEAATQFYKNLKMNVYTSNETVNFETAQGVAQIPRLRFECEPSGVLMQSASQCVLDVILEEK